MFAARISRGRLPAVSEGSRPLRVDTEREGLVTRGRRADARRVSRSGRFGVNQHDREEQTPGEPSAGGSSNPCQWRSRLAHWLVLGLRWGLPDKPGDSARATIRTRCVHALDVMSTRETPCVVWAFFGWWGHALAPPLYSLPERGTRVRTGAHGNAMAGHARRPGLPWADDGPSTRRAATRHRLRVSGRGCRCFSRRSRDAPLPRAAPACHKWTVATTGFDASGPSTPVDLVSWIVERRRVVLRMVLGECAEERRFGITTNLAYKVANSGTGLFLFCTSDVQLEQSREDQVEFAGSDSYRRIRIGHP